MSFVLFVSVFCLFVFFFAIALKVPFKVLNGLLKKQNEAPPEERVFFVDGKCKNLSSVCKRNKRRTSNFMETVEIWIWNLKFHGKRLRTKQELMLAKFGAETHTTNSAIWPVTYSCAQPYYPGSGSHWKVLALLSLRPWRSIFLFFLLKIKGFWRGNLHDQVSYLPKS